MTICVYVDDLLEGGSQEDFESFLLSLNKTLPTNDLVGESTRYDGCGIKMNAELGTIKSSQETYVKILLTRISVHATSDISISPCLDLGPKRDDESGGDWPVRKAVGSLL